MAPRYHSTMVAWYQGTMALCPLPHPTRSLTTPHRVLIPLANKVSSRSSHLDMDSRSNVPTPHQQSRISANRPLPENNRYVLIKCTRIAPHHLKPNPTPYPSPCSKAPVAPYPLHHPHTISRPAHHKRQHPTQSLNCVLPYTSNAPYIFPHTASFHASFPQSQPLAPAFSLHPDPHPSRTQVVTFRLPCARPLSLAPGHIRLRTRPRSSPNPP